MCVHSYATGVQPVALSPARFSHHLKWETDGHPDETAALMLSPMSSLRICCSQISQCLLVLSMWTFSTIFSLNLFYFLEKGSYCITWMARNTLCRPCWSQTQRSTCLCFPSAAVHAFNFSTQEAKVACTTLASFSLNCLRL